VSSVHILYSGLGGHTAVVMALARIANSKNHVIPILIFSGVENMPSAVLNQCKKLGVKYFYVPKKKGLDIKQVYCLYKELQKNKPSSILIHGTAFLLPALLYKFFHISCKLVQRDTQSALLKTRREWSLLLIGYLFCHKTIFLTAEAKQAFLSRYTFVKDNKAEIIPNPLDEGFIQEKRCFINGDIITIGMQSRLQPIKDHTTLIMAFAKLLPLHNNRIRLMIAGDGTTRKGLEDLVCELNIAQFVEFTGTLNQEQLIHFLQALDIYVHATDGETMSNAILQAMASQLPVIASDVWGVNNMIQHNVSGLLYEHKNVDSLFEAINRLIVDNDLRSAIGSTAYSKAISIYDPQIIYKQYIKVLV
jgi:glycosyltransferase involved in cell wall biosynthesis